MIAGRTLIPILAGAILAVAAASTLAANTSDPTYAAMMQRLKSGDTDIDYEDLRMAYTRSEFYATADDTDIAELRGAMFQALSAGDMKTAGDRAQRILDLTYVDIDAHMVAAVVYRRTNDDTKAEFHRTIAMGLLQSIQDSGDGKSVDTAFVVISAEEEFALLRSQGLVAKMRSMIRGGGRAFDVIDVADDAGHTGKLYFNVGIPLGQVGMDTNPPDSKQ